MFTGKLISARPWLSGLVAKITDNCPASWEPRVNFDAAGRWSEAKARPKAAGIPRALERDKLPVAVEKHRSANAARMHVLLACDCGNYGRMQLPAKLAKT